MRVNVIDNGGKEEEEGWCQLTFLSFIVPPIFFLFLFSFELRVLTFVKLN